MCNACSALEIDCLYGDDKPVFMDNGPLQKEKADWLKQEVKLRATRRRERRYLQALELGIETLDVSQVEADESDPSNDSSILPTADPTTSPSSTKPESSQTSSPGQQDEVRHQQMPAMSLPTPPNSSPDCSEAVFEQGWGIQERELHTTMLYLDYVFPFVYPFYRPPLLDAGRGWLLVLLAQNKAVLHTTLSLASHFFNVVLSHTNHLQAEPCKSHNWAELSRQQEMALQELQAEMQRIVARGVKGYLAETTRVLASVIQLLTFEVAMANTGNWIMHLDAATELFSLIVQEHGSMGQDATFFINLLVQLGARPFSKTPSNHPWSPDQASLRFSVAFIVFFDTIAATSLERPPRLLSFHRDLLTEPDEETKRSWPENDKEYRLPHIDMNEFVGLQNWIVLAIGEIATLDAWKKEKKRNGSLSVSQLVLRASVIEESLRRNIAILEQTNGHGPEKADTNPLLDLLSRPGLYPKEMVEITAATSRVWAQAVVTYLSVVVSGWQPASAEIRNSVALTIQMLLTLPSPSCMRAIMWPFTVTGCMAAREEEQTFRDLIAAMGPLQLFGTATKSLEIMEKVWANRTSIEENADQWDYAACFRSAGHAALML